MPQGLKCLLNSARAALFSILLWHDHHEISASCLRAEGQGPLSQQATGSSVTMIIAGGGLHTPDKLIIVINSALWISVLIRVQRCISAHGYAPLCGRPIEDFRVIGETLPEGGPEVVVPHLGSWLYKGPGPSRAVC